MQQATYPRRTSNREGVNRVRAIAFAILFAVFTSAVWGTVLWLDDILMGLIAGSLAVLPPLTAMGPVLNEAR